MRKEIYLAITNRIKAKGLIIKHFDLGMRIYSKP